MSDTQATRRIGRSILAGLGGILTAVIPTIATDALVHSAGVFSAYGQTNGDGPFLLATVYRTVYGLAAGYVTARLAPYRPMAHALILGAVGTVVAIIGTVVTWNNSLAFGPHWYPLALVALGMPQSWAGARLRELQLRPSTSPEKRTQA